MPRAHTHTPPSPQRIFIDTLPPATLVLASTTPLARIQLQPQIAQCSHARLLASSDRLIRAIPLVMLHRPDILLICHDYHQPQHKPIDPILPQLNRLKKTLDTLAVIACLPHNHPSRPRLEHLCDGILTPPYTSRQLAHAIEAVSCGYTVHTTPTQTPLIDGHATVQTITAREREILKLLCLGLDNREIARHLFLAESTIKSHTARLKNKLCAHNRIGLAIAAMRYGLA